eukprot:9468571-Pyramimonas_sp.AAC.2
MHVLPSRDEEVWQLLGKDEWRVFSTPSRPSGRPLGGSSGGETILVRSHVAATPFAHLSVGSKLHHMVGFTAVYGILWGGT